MSRAGNSTAAASVLAAMAGAPSLKDRMKAPVNPGLPGPSAESMQERAFYDRKPDTSGAKFKGVDVNGHAVSYSGSALGSAEMRADGKLQVKTYGGPAGGETHVALSKAEYAAAWKEHKRVKETQAANYAAWHKEGWSMGWVAGSPRERV